MVQALKGQITDLEAKIHELEKHLTELEDSVDYPDVTEREARLSVTRDKLEQARVERRTLQEQLRRLTEKGR